MDHALVHIGITVKDMERAIAFYGSVMEFKEVKRTRFDESFFEMLPDVYHLQGISADVVTMEAPEGGQIELFAFSETAPVEELIWNRQGLTHLAISCNDVPKMVEDLRKKGVSFCMETRQRKGDGGNWTFFKDPDGNLIELSEPPRQK